MRKCVCMCVMWGGRGGAVQLQSRQAGLRPLTQVQGLVYCLCTQPTCNNAPRCRRIVIPGQTSPACTSPKRATHLQHPLCFVELLCRGADVDHHHKAAIAVQDVLEQVRDLAVPHRHACRTRQQRHASCTRMEGGSPGNVRRGGGLLVPTDGRHTAAVHPWTGA